MSLIELYWGERVKEGRQSDRECASNSREGKGREGNGRKGRGVREGREEDTCYLLYYQEDKTPIIAKDIQEDN